MHSGDARARDNWGVGDSGRAAWEPASKRGCLSGRLDEGLASGSYIDDLRSTARCELDVDGRVGGVNAAGGEEEEEEEESSLGQRGKDWRSQKNQ